MIPLVETVTTLRALTKAWHDAGQRIVFVPTMGALHDGHLALIAHAKTLGERVVASIFVNPTQFGPTEDFSRYPRTLESDLEALMQAGADAAYVPSADTMYSQDFSTYIEPGRASEGLCGEFRPGHFKGVVTIVTKLINQSQADVFLFGEKDFQQLQVIRQAVNDLDIPVHIAGMSTIREADGLALSSRNRYLSPSERIAAPRLNEVLVAAAKELGQGISPDLILPQAKIDLERFGFDPVQYLELRDEETFKPISRIDAPARLLVAAYLGRTRLIDNVRVVAAN